MDRLDCCVQCRESKASKYKYIFVRTIFSEPFVTKAFTAMYHPEPSIVSKDWFAIHKVEVGKVRVTVSPHCILCYCEPSL